MPVELFRCTAKSGAGHAHRPQCAWVKILWNRQQLYLFSMAIFFTQLRLQIQGDHYI